MISLEQEGRFSQEDRFGLYLQDEWKPVQTLTVVAGSSRLPSSSRPPAG